jgi:hypothetical protein
MIIVLSEMDACSPASHRRSRARRGLARPHRDRSPGCLDPPLNLQGQLLWSDQPSDGFTTLWTHHRLDLTVEAHVLKQDYATLLTEADRQQARRRLEQYGWHDNPDNAT